MARKQTIVGYTRKGWNIQVVDFGIIVPPLFNAKKRKGRVKIKLTVEDCNADELEGAVIENEIQ
jgi:hypothetical protein